MSDSPKLQRLAISTYTLVRRTGILDTAFGREFYRSAYFLYKRRLEDDLGALITSRPELLRQGHVLDIGANIGYTMTVLAAAIDSGYQVHAFEPEPYNFGILKTVASRPEFKNKVKAYQCAVGAEDGSIELWQNAGQPADHRVITDEFRSALSGQAGIQVPLISIDQFLLRNPGPVSFAKIDVQGFELPVCQGMTKTIESNPELTIVLEYAPSAQRDLGFDPLELVRFLVARGFLIYHVRPKGEITPGIPEGLADTAYVDLLFSRRPLDVRSPA